MSVQSATAGSAVAGAGLLPYTGLPVTALGLVAGLGILLVSAGAAIWHTHRDR